MNKLEKFLEKAKLKYGDKYDYSEVKYVDSVTQIKIFCNVHNKFFLKSPVEHLRGKNPCNSCNPYSEKFINTTELFIKKAQLVHGVKYNYSKSEYKDSGTKLCIICPKHGEFNQLSNSHLKGQGCPECSKLINKPNLTNEVFIKKVKIKHGDKYDYSNTNYVCSRCKIKIICPEHGEFEQLASGHLRGKGCNKCATIRTTKSLSHDKDTFIKKAKKSHGDTYDYSEVEYVNSITKIKITCPEHGEFEQLPYDHIGNHGCLKCGLRYIKNESEIKTFIQSLNINFIENKRKILNGKELDIYIPSHNLAIEFNGLYWHSEEYIDKNYHLNKTTQCEAQGIQLIHIFEDEWINKEDIVKSRLKNLLGLTENRIYGRKCEIKNVTSKESKIFLDVNHIQGDVRCSIRLGLFYNDELVSLMSFNKPRLGIGKIFDGYELSRFCNKLNTNVIGGADKLLKHFIKMYNPKEIISYADRRWSQGGLYDKLGFNKHHINKPNYSYVIGKNRKFRFNFRKSILIKQGYDPNKSEHEIMLGRKIYRIYDCGTITYKLTF